MGTTTERDTHLRASKGPQARRVDASPPHATRHGLSGLDLCVKHDEGVFQGSGCLYEKDLRLSSILKLEILRTLEDCISKTACTPLGCVALPDRLEISIHSFIKSRTPLPLIDVRSLG